MVQLYFSAELGMPEAMSKRGIWVFWVAPPIRLMETVTSLKASGASHSIVKVVPALICSLLVGLKMGLKLGFWARTEAAKARKPAAEILNCILNGLLIGER